MNSIFKIDPYRSDLAEAYVTAVNIIAVEYLIKCEGDKHSYLYYLNILDHLTEYELYDLGCELKFNSHTSSLGAMIMQGDYDYQKTILFNFLNDRKEILT